MLDDAATVSAAPRVSTWRSWYTLALLFAVALSNYLDRSIITILQVPIQQELGLSDTQLGAMTGLAFALCYTVLGIPAARLADRTSRKAVLAASIITWSVTTMLCGLASGFSSIFAARVGVAVGEAGGSPVSHALVADQFPLGRRSIAMALWSLAIPAGAMLGLGLGGWLNELIGWRSTFLAVGAAGVILSPLVYFTVQERVPVRRPEVGAKSVIGWKESCGTLWRIKGFRYVCLGGLLHGFGMYAIYSWSAPFFTRVYHLSLAEAGFYLAIMSGVGGTIGILGGGVLADVLGRRNPKWYLLVPAASSGLLAPVAMAEFLAGNLQVSLAMGFIAAVLVHAHMGPTTSTVQSLVPEPIRAFSAAVMVMVSGLAGLSIAPIAIGALSDAMLARGMGASSLGYAIASMMVFSIAGAAAYLVGSKHLARELEHAKHAEPVVASSTSAAALAV